MPLVNSTVDFNMFSTLKWKQHKKRLLSQLNECDADFMVQRNNHGAQSESRAKTVSRNTSLNNTNNLTQVNSPQMDMHSLEKNIVSKVRSEVGSAMTTVKTRAHDKVMTAMEKW